ncbi:MAG: zinc-dependent metalloprotease [Gemmatimonadetes bacterium]|nr:zinc-dependent metalloprotease [Gemmatimonadota bacterium]
MKNTHARAAFLSLVTRSHAPGLLLALMLAGGCARAAASGGQEAAPAPAVGRAAPQAVVSIARRTAGLERHDGFFPFYYESSTGKLLLELARLGEDFLYLNSLATGLGSAGVTLDRGMVGEEAVVRFERHGPRLLLVKQNLGFRALGTDNAELVRSVEESFPVSVLGSFPIVAESAGRVLVDATDFLLGDMFDVRGRLQRAGEGDFRVDRERSALYLPRTKAFPKNTEIQALLTYASDRPGREVSQHAPDGRSLSLRQHHSFVELPPPGYEPREVDARVGIFGIGFFDYARPLDQGYRRRWISRWRLQKKDPAAAVSEPVQPIVYYLDRGVPEPYRTAFIEGAMWWNQVFEAAGFRNAFRVEDLPDGADPMDARYPLIEWVNRTEPSSSWGTTFVDPRTGEIIKAVARMDSHRSLVDFNIYAGSRPAIARSEADATGRRLHDSDAAALAETLGACGWADPAPGDWLATLDPDVSAEEFAMARRRQHIAHEVGHTLGLAHNFIAASYGRASVMDYPAPLIRLDERGDIDLADAYRNGPGAYDTLAIRFAYAQFGSREEERAGLEAIIQDGIRRGIRFITERDADPDGSIPEATRWVNGPDMLAELDRVMAVRGVLLERFGAAAIRPGEPVALLNERLVPVYLHHRYTLEAAIKAVGGMDYSYALLGDGQTVTRILDARVQRQALDRLLAALRPEALRIPEAVVAMIAPPPFGSLRDRRAFDSPAGPAFDPLAAARTLASFIVDGVLNRERAARLVSFHARSPANPSLDEVLERMIEATWGAPAPTGPGDAALRRVARRAVLDRLLALAGDDQATVEVRAAAEWHLTRFAGRLARTPAGDPAEDAFNALARRDIERFLERRENPTPPSRPLPAPPGTPIGQAN